MGVVFKVMSDEWRKLSDGKKKKTKQSLNFPAHKKFPNDIYNNKLETKNINFLANKKFLE